MWEFHIPTIGTLGYLARSTGTQLRSGSTGTRKSTSTLVVPSRSTSTDLGVSSTTPLKGCGQLLFSYGMSSMFASLHLYQVILQFRNRRHPSSCNGGPPLSITYLQMTFGHPYCVPSLAGNVHTHLLSLLSLCFQD